MNQLTYRGINYKSQTLDIQPEQDRCSTPVDRCGSQKHQNLNRLIAIKPMHYYTYRGVSYLKTTIGDRERQLLLDLDRRSQ